MCWQVGKLFALKFYPDDPFLLAAGGDQGVVAVWESDEQEVVRSRFEGRTMPIRSDYAVHGDREEGGAEREGAVGIAKGRKSGHMLNGDDGMEADLVDAVSNGNEIDIEREAEIEDLDENLGEKKSEVKKTKKKNKKKDVAKAGR